MDGILHAEAHQTTMPTTCLQARQRMSTANDEKKHTPPRSELVKREIKLKVVSPLNRDRVSCVMILHTTNKGSNKVEDY